MDSRIELIELVGSYVVVVSTDGVTCGRLHFNYIHLHYSVAGKFFDYKDVKNIDKNKIEL